MSLSSKRGGSISVSAIKLYEETRDIKDLEFSTPFCPLPPLSLSLSSDHVFFVVLSSSLPHPDDYVHDRSGERASEAPFIEILHREMGDKVFGSISM
jgi:hypothetical protein